MKILQLNIWGGKLENQIANLLKSENADVVCLQEVVSVSGGKSFFFLDLEETQRECSYEFAHFTPSHSFRYMQRTAHWGSAILSRQPFLSTKDNYIHTAPIEDFDFLHNVRPNAGRALQHVTVEHGGKLLNVLSHHGYHNPEHKNGDEETMRQCGMIVDYIKKLEGPVVLCGDFNLVPDSPSLEQINKILVNHVKKRGILTTRTLLTHKTEACDYIFTSPDIEVKNFQVLDDIVSDHKALTVEF